MPFLLQGVFIGSRPSTECIWWRCLQLCCSDRERRSFSDVSCGLGCRTPRLLPMELLWLVALRPSGVTPAFSSSAVDIGAPIPDEPAALRFLRACFCLSFVTSRSRELKRSRRVFRSTVASSFDCSIVTWWTIRFELIQRPRLEGTVVLLCLHIMEPHLRNWESLHNLLLILAV